MTAARHLRSLWLLTIATLALACSSGQAQLTSVGDGGPGPVKAEHLTAEITALSSQIPAGGHITAGLILTLEEHWHVYWINAGDSGEPPHITWKLPKGITAGPMQFPPPQRLPLGPFMDYGYEDQVAFPIEITAAPSLKPGKVHLDAQVTWIVCSDRCIPGKAHLGIDLNVVATPLPDPPQVGALGQGISWLPKQLPSDAKVAAVSNPDAHQIAVTLTTGDKESEAEFYPYDQNIIDNPSNQLVEPLAGGVRLLLTRAADPSGTAGKQAPLPTTLHGLIKLGHDEDATTYDVTIPVTNGPVPAPTATTISKKTLRPDSPPAAAQVTLISAIGLAFLGGLILNLMPCVFPVLFLKGLALVNSSTEDRATQRKHGFIYTLGILVSFWAIVGVLLAVRGGGQKIGWGFQLQSPGFVAVLALLMFFLALSLAGQFELGLSLTSAGNDLTKKQGIAGSFFTGMLAVLAATPCMGPLMGAAVGFALAQPVWVTFLVFTMLALGLALPYLILSLQPQWTSILPKPGAWMEVLKQLTAVPLFATAIWLTWVFGHLHTTSESGSGVDAIVPLLSGFLLLAIAGWALGRWPARWGSAIASIVLIAFAIFLNTINLNVKVSVGDPVWKPWSPAALAAARATGHPIFVDYTAAWCLSCQVNEKIVLHNPEIKARLLAGQVELLKADWTQYDPAITQSLATVNRSGVPTYILYPAGENSNPDVLPELLTKDIVSNALSRDVK